MSIESHREANLRWSRSKRGRETLAAGNKRWRKNNPDKAKKRDKVYYRKYRISQLCKRYNLTKEEYFDKLKKQDGRCAMSDCRTDRPGGKGSWHTDHDHTTGKFRGLLCNDCNIRLGWYERSMHRIPAFEKYRGE